MTRRGIALVLLALATTSCGSADTGGEDAAIATSVFRIRGEGCRAANIGSGFLVEPEMVLVNAHVVAGVTEQLVVTDGAETSFDAVVVAFDPIDDLALLSVPALTAAPLELGNGSPGPAELYDARIAGVIDVLDVEVTRLVDIESGDIYDDGTYLRKGLEIAADIGPGTSGAPIVQDGLVVGVAFAEVRDGGTVFATATSEIRDFLAGPRQELALPQGRCRR